MKSVQKFPDEIALIDDFRQGKKAALQQLYDIQYRPLWDYVSRILEDRDLAEDVVAESFVKIWERRMDFDNLKSLLSFLYVVARNASLDLLSQTKRRKISHEQISYLADKKEDSVHSKLIRTEILQIILIEIETLPPRLKEVFKLVYLEGLTLPETAEKLGVSFNTVKSQRTTAVKKLRDALHKKGLHGFAFGVWGF